MGAETYGRWPWAAAGMVVPAWAVAARRDDLAEDGLWVAGLALPILVSHQTEEWVWPGGFLPFCNQQLLGSPRPDWPLTERDGFHVNVSVGWVSALAGLLLWRRTPSVAAAVLWLEAGNAAVHGRGRRRSCVPHHAASSIAASLASRRPPARDRRFLRSRIRGKR